MVKSEILFSKLEDDLVEQLRERYSGSQKDRARRDGDGPPDAPEPIPPEPDAPEPRDIARRFAETLDLRTAKIVKVERHPQADKLYIETLEITGDKGVPEERVIVSGLVPHYTEEELLGRHIIVAYNLRAAKLRGVESRGMLLAASDTGNEGREQVEVLDAAGVPTGTPVGIEGFERGVLPAEIDIGTFSSIPLEVKDYTVRAGGRALTLQGKPIRTKTISSGGVR